MRKSSLTLTLVVLWVTMAPVSVGVAHADDRAAAREAYREGTRLYEVGEFQKALDAFKRAYISYPDPSLLFNLGQCYRQLGIKADALRSYRQFLSKVPDAPNRVDVERLIANLEASIAAEKQVKEAPPQEAISDKPKEAGRPEAPPPPPIVTTSAPAPAPKPLYKKWWPWTIVGGAVAVGLGVGLGVGLTRGSGSSTTLPDFGPGVGQSALVLH